MTRKEERKSDDQTVPQEPVSSGADQAAPQPASAVDDAAALRTERDDLLARLQRVSADYLNYQKRVQRELAQGREFANEELIKALLPVLDDMERAMAVVRENHAPDDPLLVGMQLVHDKALEALGRFGVSVIEAAGKKFDPALHSALMRQPSDEAPEGTVLQEVQRGYQLKGRTIRPSSVIVAAAPEPSQDEPQE
ncbi:MAG TPA: nucleotide exchange factor GrpE [Phycisphaerae bacterium]|nr:nucleotide exchange factor GrpE [Phycisphaerae bacterium]